jgi:DNA-binding transcriptional MerR regulator
MEYRIDQLAAASGVSVDTVRYYQTRRLLPSPRHEGRVAWYGDEHRQRIERIRNLQRRGLTLAAVRRVLDDEPGGLDESLSVAVAAARAGEAERVITLEEIAARCGVAVPLLTSLVNSGLGLGRTRDGELIFTETDVTMVQLGLRVLGAGLPLPDLLSLAQRHTSAMRETAEHAVALFDAHVRQPLHDQGGSRREAADALVAAFEALLPTVTSLVAHHFREVLLAVAEAHLSEVGDDDDLAAARGGGGQRLQVLWPS